MQDIEAQLETRQLRRMRDDAKAEARIERQWDEAEKLIGELCREGKTVLYINQLDRRGKFTGRIVEFSNRASAVDYLIRNRYV